MYSDKAAMNQEILDRRLHVTGHRTYSGFGVSAPASDFLFSYAGREVESATGLSYNRARFYDPAVGRFVSEDPIGFDAGDANLYRYVGNEPTSSTDPSGLVKLPPGVREVVNVGDVYEMVLKNGKRLKLRNGRFIDSCVTINMLDELTDVSKDTIKHLKHLEDTSGVALSIRYNAFGMPDFSGWFKKSVEIVNPAASNYADQAWKALRLKHRKLYDELWPKARDYVWHHAGGNEMQLVDKKLHQAFAHTGPQAIWKQLGGIGIVMVIPGYEAFREGRISDGCRNTGWGWLPHTWFSYAITGFWSGLYEWEKSEGDAFAERVREKYGTKH